MDYVEFEECKRCNKRSDITCAVCNVFYCEACLDHCVQCEQPCCCLCYKNDSCCLIRPWGEKVELFVADFYAEKFADQIGMSWIDLLVKDGEPTGSKWNEIRKQVLRDSVKHFVLENRPKELACCELVAECFPRIQSFVEDERLRLRLVQFLENLDERLFVLILVHSEDRAVLLSLLEDYIAQKVDPSLWFTEHIWRAKGKALFVCLKHLGLLHRSVADRNKTYVIEHVEGFKWWEEHGIDVVKDKEDFERFAKHSSVEVWEYLITEKGLAVEYLFQNSRTADVNILKMIHRTKGDLIQDIRLEWIIFGLKEVKFLRSVLYKFDKTLVLKLRNIGYNSIYYLVCFGVLKFEDLNAEHKLNLRYYTSIRDVKACKHMYPFMKEVRKRKVMTFLCCINKLKFIRMPKEIVWIILDLAFSPINERGFV